jgi:hypothetical protein
MQGLLVTKLYLALKHSYTRLYANSGVVYTGILAAGSIPAKPAMMYQPPIVLNKVFDELVI